MEFLYAIQKCFLEIENIFSEKLLNEFVKCNYEDLYIFHFCLGTWIRNNLLNDKVLINVFEFFCIYHK